MNSKRLNPPTLIAKGIVVSFVIDQDKDTFIGRVIINRDDSSVTFKDLESSGLVIGIPYDIRCLIQTGKSYCLKGDIVKFHNHSFGIFFPCNYDLLKEISTNIIDKNNEKVIGMRAEPDELDQLDMSW